MAATTHLLGLPLKHKKKDIKDFSHKLLSSDHEDVSVGDVVAGDLIYGDSTPKWARFPKGLDGKYLKMVSGLPSWADPPAGADHNLLSTTHPDTLAASVVRGDLLIGNLTPKWARLPIGLANRVLKSDGTDPSWGQVGHEELTGVTSNQHHAQLHASAHLVAAGDPLSVGVPVNIGTTNIEGTAANFARRDHVHAHPSGLGTDLHHAQLHKDAHKSGGGDAFALADLLDCVARLKVRKNTGASDVGARRRLNLIEGSNVTLTVADDPTNEEVDVTIASTGGGAAALFGGLLSCMDIEAVGGDTGYSVSKASWAVKVTTAATLNYTAWARWRYSGYVGSYNIFDLNPVFEFYLYLNEVSAVEDYIFCGGVSTAPTGTAKKFGIHVTSGILRLMSADGSTWSESADLMTLSVLAWYRVKVKLTSGSQIEVWVDGVSKGTKTTNLPSGSMPTGSEVMTYHVKTNEAVSKTIYGSAVMLQHD